ncbi:MAG TPA: peptidase dimerization domain-containing protein, partial [Chloroflexota bacterium]
TGFAEEVPTLCLGYKGLLYVELEVTCLRQDAHSSMAGMLPSAAWRLVGALGILRTPDGRIAMPGFYDVVRPPIPAELATYVDRPDVDAQRMAMYGLEHYLDDLTGSALWERASFAPTANIGGLSSGYTSEGMKTVLPAKALAKVDFRLVPDQDPHTIAAALRAHLDAQGYGDVEMKVLAAAEPDKTPLTEPFVQRVAAIATAFGGQPPLVMPLAPPSLPLLAPLRRHVGLPGLSAPTNATYMGGSAHAPNEHIRLEDLRRAVAFNAYLLRSLGERA